MKTWRILRSGVVMNKLERNVIIS